MPVVQFLEQIQAARGIATRRSHTEPQFQLRIENEAGEGELWTMAGTSPNHLTRRGVTADTLKVGEVIRVAGSPSTRRPLNFIVNSALLPDRTEVLLRGLGPAVDPHWPTAR